MNHRKQKNNNNNNSSGGNNNNNNNNGNSNDNDGKGNKSKKSTVGLSVGSKANFTSTGSVSSRRKNSSKRRRGKLAAAMNVESVKPAEPTAVSATPAAKSGKKKISKLDIGQPVPVSSILGPIS